MLQSITSTEVKAIGGNIDEHAPLLTSSDSAMRKIHTRIAKLASLSARVNVLITGETGAGKEVLAKLLHERSDRAEENFVVVNCAAIPENLFESELFGHVKGAFTGATSNTIGFFGQAHGGTILLDEIGELSLALQTKLLRVVQEQEIARVGEGKTRKVDVRIIAATHVDLEKAVKNGKFREDLYYRLSGTTIHVPPLRERSADIPALAVHLLGKICRSLDWKDKMHLAPETIVCLQAYHFPGNVRELRQVLAAAIVDCEGELILPEHLPEKMRVISKTQGPLLYDAKTLKRMVERERIRWALEQTAGNQTRAAELLKMPLRTFVDRLGRHGFPRPKQGAEHMRRPAA